MCAQLYSTANPGLNTTAHHYHKHSPLCTCFLENQKIIYVAGVKRDRESSNIETLTGPTGKMFIFHASQAKIYDFGNKLLLATLLLRVCLDYMVVFFFFFFFF